MAETAKCKNCQETIEIPDGWSKPFIACPQCGKMSSLNLAARPARPAASTHPSAARPGSQSPSPVRSDIPPAPPPARAGTPPPPGPGGAADADLPEVMKANKRIVGRNCTVCEVPIQLGESIHNCPNCRQSSHEKCWNTKNGCGNIACHGAEATPSATPAKSIAPLANSQMAVTAEGMIPCRWCKEPIMRGARKCKHCGEFQRDEDRNTQGALVVADEALSTTDWIAVVCCPLIALIQGFVWVSAGNPKGPKILKYALLSMAISAVLKAAGR